MRDQSVEPHVFVILGATGDLTRRKLLPALYHLRDQGEEQYLDRRRGAAGDGRGWFSPVGL